MDRDCPKNRNNKMVEIKGFKGYYVERNGQVHGRDGPLKGCITSHGYRRYTLAGQSYRYGHVLVADAFIPNPEGYRLVNHLDGDKSNNNDWNLQRANHSMNLKHAHETGLRGSPENRKNAATTEAEVIEIRKRFEDGERQCDLAIAYNLSPSFISKLILRKEWKHY